MTLDLYEMALRLLAALAAGSLIGYERSFHGRPAGFRTPGRRALTDPVLLAVPPAP